MTLPAKPGETHTDADGRVYIAVATNEDCKDSCIGCVAIGISGSIERHDTCLDLPPCTGIDNNHNSANIVWREHVPDE